MRRAILVTTGAVVGMASVIAYKPSERMAVSGLSVTSLTPASVNTSTTASSTAAPAATTAAATPAATRKARAHKARARKRTTGARTHKATTAARAKATSTPTTASTPKPTVASGAFTNADGTFRSASQQVVSHGRYYGDASIAVTVHAGRITAITFNETGGNFQFADAVQQYLVPEIIKQQNVSVGIVSGATGSSMALINGLNSVLKKA